MLLYYSYIAPGIFLASLPWTTAHSRWACPEARSPDTGIKTGPCGDETEDFDADDNTILEIAPGPMRVTFEESVHHTGAPFRISLSGEFVRPSPPPAPALPAVLSSDGTHPVSARHFFAIERRRWNRL